MLEIENFEKREVNGEEIQNKNKIGRVKVKIGVVKVVGMGWGKWERKRA